MPPSLPARPRHRQRPAMGALCNLPRRRRASPLGGHAGLRRLRDAHRAGHRPVPIARRRFQAATAADLELVARAQTALAARTGTDGTIAFVPDRAIPTEGRADDRLLAY